MHLVGSFCSDVHCPICGAYVAGFVDGEGTFLLDIQRHRDRKRRV